MHNGSKGHVAAIGNGKTDSSKRTKAVIREIHNFGGKRHLPDIRANEILT